MQTTNTTQATLLQAIAATTNTTGVFVGAASKAFGITLPSALNGVTAPIKAGACATVWVYVLSHLQTHNALPTNAQCVTALPQCNVNNVKIEAARARKWLMGVGAFIAAQAPVATATTKKQANAA